MTILRFRNGVTATFNLSGFTNQMTRTLKIMGEDGEIRASEAENEITVTRFGSYGAARCESEVIHPEIPQSGHSGGDSGIVDSFLSVLAGSGAASATDIHESVESHMMACAAEESRLTGRVIRIESYRQEHGKEDRK